MNTAAGGWRSSDPADNCLRKESYVNGYKRTRASWKFRGKKVLAYHSNLHALDCGGVVMQPFLEPGGLVAIVRAPPRRSSAWPRQGAEGGAPTTPSPRPATVF